MLNLSLTHCSTQISNRKPGYTLIELLITTTLTTMLITFGVSAYRLASDRQLIKSQTELILTTLTQAQKAATTGKTDCQTEYLGEEITVTSNSSALTLTSICKSDSGTPRTITLSTLTFANNQTFVFRPLNQGVDTGSTSTLNLDYGLSSRTFRIEITRSGSIRSLGEV